MYRIKLHCRAMYLVQTHTSAINSERQEILGFPAVKSVATGDKTMCMYSICHSERCLHCEHDY